MLMTTMREVAERAGVSATTVSFVLNGRQPANGPISADTKQRVLTAAKELGYRPNGLAKAIVQGHNQTIGFLARFIWHEFTARILTGAIEEARQAGYGVQVLLLKNDILDKESIESCLEMRLAGLITVDMDPNGLEYLYSEMRPYNIPIAFLDTSFRQDWGIHITTDDAQGCKQAVTHLVDLGHKRIAYIGGEVGRGMTVMRDQAFLKAMIAHNLKVPKNYIGHGNWSTFVAEDLAMKMLRLKNPPTAIICANDEMAYGVQKAARRLGVKMPQELSLIGFSDVAIANMADPPLTSVHQPKEEIGRAATQLLLESMKRAQDGEDVNAKPLDILLPTTLKIRASTAPPPLP